MNREFEQFKDVIKEFFSETVDQLKNENFKESVELLQNSFDSTEAAEFTNNTNKMFKRKQLKDDNGNPIEIKNPSSALKQAISYGDEVECELSEEQERWFRANQLYGNNILKKSGFE